MESMASIAPSARSTTAMGLEDDAYFYGLCAKCVSLLQNNMEQLSTFVLILCKIRSALFECDTV